MLLRGISGAARPSGSRPAVRQVIRLDGKLTSSTWLRMTGGRWPSLTEPLLSRTPWLQLRKTLRLQQPNCAGELPFLWDAPRFRLCAVG